MANTAKSRHKGRLLTPPTPRSQKMITTFKHGDRTLKECFQVFALTHRLVNSLPIVARVVREVIADFAADGVAYAEIRTTPRA